MQQKRKEKDVLKLMLSDYKVEALNEAHTEFLVDFHAPRESVYEGGVFKVHVELPDQYPIKSPSIGFITKIFHPNIDLQSGTVCLDVINQTWSPMFDLKNVFDVFLPQLLLYPNPHHPLNSLAASMLLKKPEEYARHVREMVVKHARPALQEAEETLSDISREGLSDLSVTSGLDEDLL